MLLGQYTGALDKKGRVAFPKRFREIIGEKLIITQGYEYTLIIVSESGWKALLEGTEGIPFLQAEARETQRFLLGNAAEITLDSKGRFIVPSYLRIFGRMGDEVVFVGLSRFIEVWDKKRWEIYQKELEGKIAHVAKKLMERPTKKVE